MRGQVTVILLTRIYKTFKAENIEIPFNKRDIYIKGMPETFQSVPGTNPGPDSTESE